MKKKVTIAGFGRFGKLWAALLHDEFAITVIEPNLNARREAVQEGYAILEADKALRSADTVFYAVPISAFEEVLASHLQFFKAGSLPLFIDLLSVKLHPQKVFEKLLPAGARSMLCHPMFGRESVKAQGFAGLPVMIDRHTATAEEFNFWSDYFKSKKLVVEAMSADEHDKLAARSQGVVHFMGRILGELNLHPTSIDTLGAKKLFEIQQQVCNDSWQLFVDLQTYNPYTIEMRSALGAAQQKIYNQLLPNRVHKDKLVVGIQGGKGSFNEQAARYYLERAGVTEFELRYLHTTEKVLRALHEGVVDRGQFAMHNSTGGIVNESVDAMTHYTFHIVEEFSIKISHALMIRKDAALADIDTVISHPQVFRQCTRTLKEKYPRLKTTSGEGDAIDSAKAAELISKGELPKNYASMGGKALAEIYGLKVVEDNLQDNDQNFTSFLWVERPQ